MPASGCAGWALDRQTRTHTHRQTHRHTQTHTRTHTHNTGSRNYLLHPCQLLGVQAGLLTDRHAHTHTDRHTDTRRHAHAHTHTTLAVEIISCTHASFWVCRLGS